MIATRRQQCRRSYGGGGGGSRGISILPVLFFLTFAASLTRCDGSCAFLQNDIRHHFYVTVPRRRQCRPAVAVRAHQPQQQQRREVPRQLAGEGPADDRFHESNRDGGSNPGKHKGMSFPEVAGAGRGKNRKKSQKQKSTGTSNPSKTSSEKARRRGGSAQRQPVVGAGAQLSFARDGHCALRGILNPGAVRMLRRELLAYARKRELEAWQQKVQVAASPPTKSRGGASEETKKKLPGTVRECQVELRRLLGPGAALPFLQFFHTWRSVPAVRDGAFCARLAEAAAVLLDVPSVRLYQDALFWKRAIDGPTPWHADAKMAPFDTSAFVTFWIPLVDDVLPVGGGGLVFCSKTHADFALPYWSPPASGTWEPLDERYAHEELVDYMPLAAGDCTAHHGWVLHCADAISPGAAERMGGDRLALAVSFVDARAPVRSAESRASCGDDEDAWSYRDWVDDVPSGSRDWDHPLVPKMWPPSRRSQQQSATKFGQR